MSNQIPISKQVFRFLLKLFPRTKLSYNIGKIVTRTILKPENKPTDIKYKFAGIIPMKLDLSEFASNDLYCLDNHFESVTLKLWRQIALESETILDVGSHVGTFALSAASVNPEANIIAVEICKRNLGFLAENTAPYKNIKIYPVAIGEKPGKFIFHEDYKSGGGYLKTANTDSIRKRYDTDSSYEVEAVTLFDLCKNENIKSIDLIKIDLEGLEYSLLTGQDDFWNTYSPKHVVVEIGIHKSEKEKFNTILNSMERRGYSYKKYQNLYAFPWLEKEDLANWYFKKELRSSI